MFAINLFMSALSSAIVEIISPAMTDPNLIWPYVGIGLVVLPWRLCFDVLASMHSCFDATRLVSSSCADPPSPPPSSIPLLLRAATFGCCILIWIFFRDLDNVVAVADRPIEGLVRPEERREEKAGSV